MRILLRWIHHSKINMDNVRLSVSNFEPWSVIFDRTDYWFKENWDILMQLPYKRKFSRVSNFAILWSKVVSLFSRVKFFANLRIHKMLIPEIFSLMVCRQKTKWFLWSSGGRVVKLLACGARGPGFDSRPRHLNFQRLVISCFQVEIWLKDR